MRSRTRSCCQGPGGRDHARGLQAAAGALEHAVARRCTNLSRALDDLKDAQVWSAPWTRRRWSLLEVDLTAGTALVLGSEGKGVRPLVARRAPLARFPMRDEWGR